MSPARAFRTDRFEDVLGRHGTVESLAAGLFDVLRPDVAFAFACLATTDPLSGVITYAYKSDPLDIGDEEFAAAEYGGPDVNLFAEIARRPVPVGLLSADTGGHPEECHRFREFMAPRFGFTDEARVVLGSRGLTWGALGLYRGPGEPPFSGQDADRLVAVREIVAEAVRRTLFTAVAGHDDVPEPAVVIVDGAGRPQQMTRAARERIEDLGGWDHGELPAGLLSVAASARSSAEMVVSRVRLGSGRWLTLRGSALDGPGERAGVVVTIDPARPAELNRLTLIGLGLTEREQDIVNLVVKGASTKAIAETLHLSPHTVQDHLKAIFAKFGINSRRELVSQLHE